MCNPHSGRHEDGASIAVIIPYFQRETGILARALRSIAAQTLAPDTTVTVLVVDDASPLPPERDCAAVAWPHSMTLEIIKRPNGGPGAARNTGLEHVQSGTTFVAFLDSDDFWNPDHVQRALNALGSEGDFYFCDHVRPDGISSHFAAVCREEGEQLVIAQTDERLLLDADLFVRLPASDCFAYRDTKQVLCFLRCYLAQTSTIVYRWHTYPALRFEEHLRSAGEDYLFTMQLASHARRVCFSSHRNVIRGKGINLYDHAVDWNHEDNLNLVLDNYRCLLHARRLLKLDRQSQALLHESLAVQRGIFTYLLFKRLLTKGRFSIVAFGQAVREEPLLPLMFPRIAIRLVSLKLRGLGIDRRIGTQMAPGR